MENALQIGKAREYIVCADLIIRGYVAYPSEQGLPYDVVVDCGGKLLKIQVKTTVKAKINPSTIGRGESVPSYFFHVKANGKKKAKKYRESDVDIFALVAIDSRTIGYLHYSDIQNDCRVFRSDEHRGDYYGESGAIIRKGIIEKRKSGMTSKQIAAESGLEISTVQKYLAGKLGMQTKGQYLSEQLFATALAKTGAVQDRDHDAIDDTKAMRTNNAKRKDQIRAEMIGIKV